MGETRGGKPGQPQLTPWALGIFPGLQHNGWQHSINAGPAGRILVRSFRRSAAPGGRAGLGVGQKSAVPTADPPPPTPRNPVTPV